MNLHDRKGHALSSMILLATQRHDGQFDKAGVPYILHVLKVLHYCRTEDEEIQCMCVGHDLVEDTDTTYEELRTLGFSERVIEGIRCLTKVRGETHAQYMERLINNPDATLVKLADLRHNSDIRRLKGVGPKDLQRIEKYHNMWLELRDSQLTRSSN